MKVHANMQLNEKLDYIAQGESLSEQVRRSKEIAKVDATFAPFMRMATTKEESITGLPEGMPDVYKPDTNIPDGVSFTTARQEFRRIKNFLPSGSMQNVPKTKREISWMQMMEGLHWKESTILVHIKDQTLFSIYPNMAEVLTELGIKINIPAATDVTKKVKKSKV